jgi:hypothetical protein
MTHTTPTWRSVLLPPHGHLPQMRSQTFPRRVNCSHYLRFGRASRKTIVQLLWNRAQLWLPRERTEIKLWTSVEHTSIMSQMSQTMRSHDYNPEDLDLPSSHNMDVVDVNSCLAVSIALWLKKHGKVWTSTAAETSRTPTINNYN